MSKTKYLQFVACIVFLSCGFAASGRADSGVEEWKTVIPCGGDQYIVTSHCKASSDPFELNTCRPGQQLAVGDLSIEIPAKARAATQAPLFATHWQCVKTDEEFYLLLDFSTGTGRSASDEAVEFYDRQLRRLTRESIIRRIYKYADEAPDGYVRSIYPGEGG